MGACRYAEPEAKEAQHPTLGTKTWAKPGLSTGSQLSLRLDSWTTVRARKLCQGLRLDFVGQEEKRGTLYRYLNKYLKPNHLKI